MIYWTRNYQKTKWNIETFAVKRGRFLFNRQRKDRLSEEPLTILHCADCIVEAAFNISTQIKQIRDPSLVFDLQSDPECPDLSINSLHQKKWELLNLTLREPMISGNPDPILFIYLAAKPATKFLE